MIRYLTIKNKKVQESSKMQIRRFHVSGQIFLFQTIMVK